MHVERQGGAAARRDRHRLAERVGVGAAVAVEPCLPGTAVGGLGGAAVDHAGPGGPRRGGPGLEAGVAEPLARATAATTTHGEGERRRTTAAATAAWSP